MAKKITKKPPKRKQAKLFDDGTIFFYRSNGKHGFLSNLYKKEIIFEGIVFDCAEKAYMYGKFNDPIVRDWTMTAPFPRLVSYIGHGITKFDVSEGWADKKVERMYQVLKVKFQDGELRKKLLKTGNRNLVEQSSIDPFWGIGKKGNGKNMLGKLLMRVRKEIINQES